MGRMQNSGQACIAAKRLIVPEDIYEPFVEGLKQAFSTFSPGDPSDPSTTLAPLSSEQAAKDLHAQIQDAVDKGATVVTGGGRPDHAGAFVEPTILTDVTPDMRAYPRSCSARPPSSTRSRTRTRRSSWPTTRRTASAPPSSPATWTGPGRVADRLEAGMVFDQPADRLLPELPFGGVKRSGYGRELSELGMFEFANRKLICAVAPDAPVGGFAG